MNLLDILSRPDRSGEVTGAIAAVRTDGKRGVKFTARSSLRIRNAHEFFVCRTLGDFGWTSKDGPVSFKVMAGNDSYPLALNAGSHEKPVSLNWPAEMVGIREFDIVIEAKNDATVFMGRNTDLRALAASLANGRGVEVGPGLKPTLKPSPVLDVSYVEEKHPKDWEETYHKQHELPPAEIFDRYVIGSGTVLEMVEPGSLDFVFSAHVLEHLPNPLQVLTNWLATLKPGGLIIALVPDPRFTFDCRQPPSTMAEMLEEEARGGHAIAPEKYERWCKHTEPRHTPADLLRRNYSIHVNFLTPEGASAVGELLVSRKAASRYWIRTEANHREFVLAIWK
ncbi:MAG TPA: methyltransferase domain-containing protein [Hyphomonadaceae bacterium]|jgi:SAM-dependent methyltransferase|nr:methyltransferase domain-containing protein [Hyphomonadaceae bacterium]